MFHRRRFYARNLRLLLFALVCGCAASIVARSSVEGASEHKRLVLGDENRLTVEALGLALAGCDYEVVATVTTSSALFRALLAYRPDLCLLEPRILAGVSSDVIDRARQRVPNVKFLVFSTDTTPARIASVIESGAVGCLSKNQGMDALALSVARATRGELVIEPALARATLQEFRKNRDHSDKPLRWLTRRELEVLRRLTQGDGTREIARELGMSVNTARTHLQNVLDKLGVHSRLEAVALANRASPEEWRDSRAADDEQLRR